MRIRLIFSGRGYDAAANLPTALEIAEGATLDDLLQAVNERLPPARPLAPSCLIAVSGIHLGTLAQHAPCALREGDEVLLIGPVAGG